MLDDVDAALGGLLAAAVTARGAEDVVLSFQSPAAQGGQPGGAPTLALFLYDIRENLTGRGADLSQIRDQDNRVAVRQLAPRRYELSYLVTAHAATVTEEHRLLGMVLATCAELEAVPPRYLGGKLASTGLPVGLRVAAPTAVAAPWDLWQALGIAPRTCLDLLVMATLIPEAALELAPPAEHLVLDAGTGARAPRPDVPRPDVPREARRWTTTRVRDRSEPKG
jgi:Pvc16 N-terminal domain